MPLDALRLNNFQAHEKSELQLSPGVTAIIGASDAGKSSIIRALRWVIDNRPNSTSFIKNGEKEAVVELSLDHHQTIKRTRGRTAKAKNEYVVNGKEPLKALKGEVPLEVSSILDMSPYSVQTQHDPYFLLTQSPGNIAKELNDLCGVTKVSTVVTRVNQLLAAKKHELKHAEQSASKFKMSLDVNAFWHEVFLALTDIQSLQKEHEKVEASINTLKRTVKMSEESKTLLVKQNVLVSAIDTLMSGLPETLDHLGSLFVDIEKIGKLMPSIVVPINIINSDVGRNFQIAKDELDQLFSIIFQSNLLRDASSNISTFEKEMEMRVKVAPFDTALNRLPDALSTLKDQTGRISVLKAAFKQICDLNQTASHMKAALDAKKNVVEAIEATLGVCPLCGCHFKKGDDHESCRSR